MYENSKMCRRYLPQYVQRHPAPPTKQEMIEAILIPHRIEMNLMAIAMKIPDTYITMGTMATNVAGSRNVILRNNGI